VVFDKRPLLIATKHQKEKVIAPVLEKALGVNCKPTIDFDTDQFGTFSGEVPRKVSPLNAVIAKCKKAMELYHVDLAVASEGSFAPHPSVPFAPANEEIVCLVDSANHLTIYASEISFDTNFQGEYVNNLETLYQFLERAKFPSHGVILKPAKEGTSPIYKGLTSIELVKKHYEHLLKTKGQAYVETDMRALYNPSRMEVIKKATEKLAAKLLNACPECNIPGFDIVNSTPGLPCAYCGTPTSSIVSVIYLCQHCNYQLIEKYPHNKKTEDPMYCPACNP